MLLEAEGALGLQRSFMTSSGRSSNAKRAGGFLPLLMYGLGNF